MTTFLRAIRAGVIHFRHAATVLAHYGRLGATFDLCSKVIVEILREEGMYKDNGDAVVNIISQALQEVSGCLADLTRCWVTLSRTVLHPLPGLRGEL